MSDELNYLLASLVPDEQVTALSTVRAHLLASNYGSRGDAFLLADRTSATKDVRIMELLQGYDYSLSPERLEIVELQPSVHNRRNSLDLNSRGSAQSEQRRPMLELVSQFFARSVRPNFAASPYASAGGLYTVQPVVVPLINFPDAEAYGVWHVRAQAGIAERINSTTRPALRNMISLQAGMDPLNGALLIAFVVLPYATLAKYGTRGYKFVLFEIGSMIQHIASIATEYNWAARAVGGFDEQGFASVLGLSPQGAYVELIQILGPEAIEH
jgi:SagB-type dehydrogenase family enzyme